jgi:hypothetical protein
MFRLVIEVEQVLEVSAPSDPEVLNYSIETIKDPDPYISDEPCTIDFRSELVKVDTVVDSGVLKAHRVLSFIFEFVEIMTFASWIADEYMSDATDKSNPEEILQSIYPDMLCTRLICDYEGSTIDDEVSDYANSYSLIFAGYQPSK